LVLIALFLFLWSRLKCLAITLIPDMRQKLSCLYTVSDLDEANQYLFLTSSVL